MQNIDINEVYGAIDALYGDNSSSQNGKETTEKASEWLGELQKSQHAWRIADQLLHLKRDMKSCFFAAQTLRTKVAYSFGELPADVHENLRNSMFDHLSYITVGTHSGITIQLCVAAADIALLMPMWEDPFTDLVAEFGIDGRRSNLVSLLEVLIALPEELNRHKLKVGKTRREELTHYYKAQVPKIIQLLHCIATNTSLGDIHDVKILRCLSSWFNLYTKEWAKLTETRLLNFVINIVANPGSSQKQHEVATDCVCSALIMLADVEIPTLSEYLITYILRMEEPFHMAVAMEDLSAVSNYARMFSELGETLVEVMLLHPPPAPASVQVLNLLLMCVGHHEWEVAEITFNFWYKISEIMYRKNDDELNSSFAPYVERLFQSFYRHCQIDVDHEGALLESEDFQEFRDRVQDLIRDVAFIFRSKKCFIQMTNILKSADTQKSWHLVEAALFIMQSVARNLLPSDNTAEENAVVMQVMTGILAQGMPAENTSTSTAGGLHIQVAITSLQLLTELREWISCHSHILPDVLTFCTNRLRHPQLATQAAKTLNAVCITCQEHIGPHFDGLLQIVYSLDTFSITNQACIGLLKAVSLLLNHYPNPTIKTHIQKLCAIQIEKLGELVKNDNVSIENRNPSTDPVLYLDRLSCVFRHMSPKVGPNEEHPCEEVVMMTWPTIHAVMTKYCSDFRVMEHCCKYLRFAVRCVHKHSAPLLPILVETIVTLYSSSGHSCLVYLGSILVDEYGTEPGCINGLISMLQALVPKTFDLLTQPNGFKNNPDTVDDWFRLCTRFLQRCPIPFLKCVVIETIVQCGLQACLLDHRDANAAVLKFFQDLIITGMKGDEDDALQREKTQLVAAILDRHSQTLVDNLITGTVYVLPTYMHYEVAETFYKLVSYDRAKLCVLLENKLKTLPRTNSSGTVAATQQQVQDLHAVITGASKSRDITRTLIDFSKLYI